MAISTNGLKFYWNARDTVRAGDVLQNLAPGGVPLNTSIYGASYNRDKRTLRFLRDGDYMHIATQETRMTSATAFTFEYIYEPLNEYIDGYHELFNGASYLDQDMGIPGFYQTLYNSGAELNYSATDASIFAPKRTHYTVVRDATGNQVRIFIDGVLKLSVNTAGNLSGRITFGKQETSGLLINQGVESTPYILDYYAMRFYDRALTDAEVLQNFQNGDAVGLSGYTEPDLPPDPNADNTPPRLNTLSVSRTKVSDETTQDRLLLSFTFDRDVTQWSVNVLGADPFTGMVADNGGAVSAGTRIQAEVDWQELYQEGQNRINIYGKGANGIWTPYDEGRLVEGMTFSTFHFGQSVDGGPFQSTVRNENIDGGNF